MRTVGSDLAVGTAHFFDQLIFSGSVSQLQKKSLHSPACKPITEENLMRSRIIWTMLASGVVLIGVGMMQLRLTALQEPGLLETRITNQAKHFTIRRASSQGIPPRPVDIKASREAGATHYGLDCGTCHGVDGRAQTASGRWMYPRATDLTSEEVQSYSDQELFWIIKNGIRYTGMPAFGKMETADNIWGLVNYVRTLSNTK